MIPNLNICCCKFRLFLLVLPLATWEKRLTPTLLQICSRWCREWQGPHWAAASPGTLPALFFSGRALAPQCLSCSQGPKTEQRVQGMASTEEGEISHLTGHTCWSRPGSHWPSWPCGHTLAHVQPMLSSTPVLFCQTAFQPFFPQPVVLIELLWPRQRSSTWPCWTSSSWLSHIDPACPDCSAEPSCSPADEHSHSTWYYLQSENLSIPLSRPYLFFKNIIQDWALGTPVLSVCQLDVTLFPTCVWVQPASFFHSGGHTRPNHVQPVCPGEYCGKCCLRLYEGFGTQHTQPFAHPLCRAPCHTRRSGWSSQTCLSINPYCLACSLACTVCVLSWHSRIWASCC